MKRLLVFGLQCLFAALLVFTAFHAQSIAVHAEYFFLFSLILIFVMLPLTDHFSRIIQKGGGLTITPDAYIETIDSIIQINSIDEILSSQFNSILSLLGLEEGTMIFYDREREEYTVYLKKVNPDTFTPTLTLDYDNVLLRFINSPEDIIIRSSIAGKLSVERSLVKMMDHLNAEIIVPMYFSGMLTGAMLLGNRDTPYTSEEISALKILASKIASLSINSMFWKELARKIELEKERKLELRVQRSFLPEERLMTDSCSVSVFFNMNAVLFDRFHTLFAHNGITFFVSYRTLPENRSTLIFLPPLAILIETFICAGEPLLDAVIKSKKYIMERNMFDAPPQTFVCSISPDGTLSFQNETRIEPFLFNGTSLIYPAKPGTLVKGDMFIYTNTHIKKIFIEYSIEIAGILSSHANSTTDQVRDALIRFLHSINIIQEKSFFALFRYGGNR
ncbi:MAG: GAF domain-containing protein [Spirochaetota bacterium]